MRFLTFNLGLLCILTTTWSYAAPIENVGLSQNTTAQAQPMPAADNNAPTSTNLNWQLLQKNEKLEEEIRRLRGSLEEHDNEIQQLKKDVENRYADLDQRLQILQQKLDATGGEQAPTEPTNAPTAAPTPTPTAPSPTTPPAPAASEPQAKAAAPVVAPSNNAAPKAMSEKDAYTLALDAYKQGGAKQAIGPIEDFIKNYPQSVYIANAHFWLAEFNLAITPANYNAAKKNYEIVAKQYPKSDKAPRALYQLYSIAKEVDRNKVSTTLYKQQLLKSYPQSKEAGFVKT